MGNVLKDVELRLIAELMKNSRRSDRDLAKSIGTSQPTVTRIRGKLEKEGYIREYTAIPDLRRIGYEILALTFVKLKTGLTEEETEKAREMARDSINKFPFGFAMIERGIGMEYNGVIITYHQSYASYLELLKSLRKFTFLELSKVDGFLISLADEVHYVPLTMSSLAKHVLTLQKEKKHK